jgi:hypothetical protein
VTPSVAADKAKCDDYARRAIAQYNQMLSFTDRVKAPRCRIADDGRWQANYNNHFNWCWANIDAHPDWLIAEDAARRTHILNDCEGPG